MADASLTQRTAGPVWFVGSSFHGNADQTHRFLTEGSWEITTPTPAEEAVVREMRVGDRIVIKSTFVQKNGLPFDNRGYAVSSMRIKAVGTITENPMDGERVAVRWQPNAAPKDWLFHTYRRTIWRVMPGTPDNDALIAFALDDVSQDIDRFRNAPGRADRFGNVETLRFAWTAFYEAIATALLRFRADRKSLLVLLQELASRHETLGTLSNDKYAGGDIGFLRDIDPFTTMGLFNRGITRDNRRAIAGDLARVLGVSVPVPSSFDGIPLLNNMRSWFFAFEENRPADHIDSLWAVFAAALTAADADGDADDVWVDFDNAFDDAHRRYLVSWNLTIGLYWARPWDFLPLDKQSRTYLVSKLGTPRLVKWKARSWQAADYRELMDTVRPRFLEQSFPVHSFPELSQAAWRYSPAIDDVDEDVAEVSGANVQPTDGAPATPRSRMLQATPASSAPYTVDDVVQDGCFLDKDEIQSLINRLHSKKNLILQGPPGTGKTWLARRLAFALMGHKDESRVRVVQFHAGLSYEDFVRGWRPSESGRLAVVDGTFLREIELAQQDPSSPRVVVIEEINRGHPAQIFGELLTLLEDSKRTPECAVELCYPGSDGSHRAVHVPANLFVIGTMNLADRSIALVDLALRRRFAFAELHPRLGRAWRQWVEQRCDLDPALTPDIERRISELNAAITANDRLGPACCVGHSYVTPAEPIPPGTTRAWFRQVVATEIGPLLDEYWADAPKQAQEARGKLLAGW